MYSVDRVVQWFLFFKQKTAYEMRISDWSSDVCSSDLSVIVHDRFKLAAVHAALIIDIAQIGLDSVVDNADWSARPGIRADISHLDGRGGNALCVLGMKIGRASCRERVCQFV